jgi:hypothetical protein
VFGTRHRREERLREAEIYRTVRRVAHEDVMAVVAVSPDHATVRTARAALEDARKVEDLLALEAVVTAAWTVCGLTPDPTREVRVGDRRVRWDRLGSYTALARAAYEAEPTYERHAGTPPTTDDTRLWDPTRHVRG